MSLRICITRFTGIPCFSMPRRSTRSLARVLLCSALLASTGAKAETTLVLGDQVKTVQAIVEASGVMKGAPYHYKWANFQGAAPLFEAMRAGAVDTAMAGDLPVLIALAGQVPLKIVATRDARPDALGIVVPRDSPIKTVKDLKGKEVVVSSARGSISQYQLYGALNEVGLTPNDVHVRFVLPTDAAAAFNSGQIQAWATFNPYFAIASQAGGRVLRDGKGINPNLDFITATKQALADPDKRAAIADFLKRLARAGEWANEHPADYIKAVSRATGLPLPVAKLDAERTAHNTRSISHADNQKLKTLSTNANAEKILPFRIDVPEAVDNSLWHNGND